MSTATSSRKNDKIKYFDCQLTDGKEICRLVSFVPKAQSPLEELMEKGKSVGLVNCEIKKSKMSSGYEVILSEKSLVVSSPKFKVGDDILSKKMVEVFELTKLSMIDEIVANLGNKVIIKGKAISVKNCETINANDRVFTKRECVFSDDSRACRLVLWEDLVESMEKGKYYRVSNACVKAYNSEK